MYINVIIFIVKMVILNNFVSLLEYLCFYIEKILYAM